LQKLAEIAVTPIRRITCIAPLAVPSTGLRDIASGDISEPGFSRPTPYTLTDGHIIGGD